MSYLQFTVPSEPISLDYVPEVRLRYLKFAFCQPFFLDLGTRYQQVHCTVAQLLASSLALTREDLLNIIGGHHLTKPCDLRKKFDIARWLLQHSCNSLCQSTVYVFDIQRHERDIGTSVLLPTKPGTVPVRARPLTAISDVQLPPTLKDKANELQGEFRIPKNATSPRLNTCNFQLLLSSLLRTISFPR